MNKRNSHFITRICYAPILIFMVSLLLSNGVFAAEMDASTDMEEAAPTDSSGPATYIGEKECFVCHEQADKHFKHTLHAKAFRLNPRNEKERHTCEACHGPGSKHAEDNEDHSLLIGFSRGWGTPIEVQNAQCLSCHQGGQRLHWPGSTHDLNKVGCSECHDPMENNSATGALKRASISETCFTCHNSKRAEFSKRSHMPLLEGKMSCEDCHNPHGSATRPLLKADSVNEVCYACHPERRGPFIWEHAPVRENCLNCHNPHGSNHDKLLASARPYLCQQCHMQSRHPGSFYGADRLATGGAPSQRVIGRACQTCHPQIHGSNHPAGARFQR